MTTQTTTTTHKPGQAVTLTNKGDKTVTVYNGITGDKLYTASPDLIAAAPDLLTSLRDLCGAAGPFRGGRRITEIDRPTLEAALSQAFAAIAADRAQGKA